MVKDIVILSNKFVIRYKVRYIFIVISITVVSVFLGMLFSSYDIIEDSLKSMVENYTISDKQISIQFSNEDEILDYIQASEVCDRRIKYKVLIYDMAIECNGNVSDKFDICIYSGNDSLITQGEAKCANINISDIEGSVFVTERLVKENNLDLAEVLKGAILNISYLDVNNKEGTAQLKIDGILTEQETACINVKDKSDVYINNMIFENLNVDMQMVGCTLEYSSAETAREVASELENSETNVTYDDSYVQEKEAEMLIYKLIFLALILIILVATVLCVLMSMGVLLSEISDFIGVLKAVGYRKMQLFMFGISQAVVVSLIGIILGGIILFVGQQTLLDKILSTIIFTDVGELVTQKLIITDYFMVGMMMLLINIIGGLIPMIRIANMSTETLVRDKN